MGADVQDLLVQRRLRDFAFLDVLDQTAVPAHKTDVQFLLRFVPLAANHDAITVAVRPGTGDDRRNPCLLKPANALKQISNLFVFQPQLRGVINVLILATAALAEVAARRFDALRRRLNDAQKFRAGKILFDLRDGNLHDFADEHKWHEHDKGVESRRPRVEGGVTERLFCFRLSTPWRGGAERSRVDSRHACTPDAFTAERDVLNRQGEVVGDFERHAESLRKAKPARKVYSRVRLKNAA